MQIAQTFASKAIVAAVATAMVFSFAAPAKAATAEELQAQIAALMAQIAALQGGSSTTSTSGVCPFTWTRDLKTGATGADVMSLQKFLNANADTRVAATGAGSTGMETQTFGPATAAAVSKFQVMYRADILTPAGLTNPTGFFGPSTRAKANALCATVTTPATTTPATSTPSKPSDLSGEADFDEATLDTASDDTVEEGQSDAEIAELTVSFVDGDASISRLDISIASTSVDNWDVLDTVSLWVDGKQVAEMDASDKDAYQSDDVTLRFNGLDIVANEDEDLDITIAASFQDGIDSTDLGDFDVDVEGMRYFDADGVAETLDDADIDVDPVSFTLEAAGADDEVIVRENDNNPTAETLELKDDAKSDWYEVFTFDIDTDDSTNDIELTTVVVNLTTTVAGYDTLVDDTELVIDGTTIDDVTVGGTHASAGTATLTFDVDGDVVVDAGDRVEATLKLRFNSLAGANEGATIVAAVNGSSIKAEGADDVTGTGSDTGETMTLRTSGITLTQGSTDSDVVNNDTTVGDSYGTFETTLTLKTVGQDDLYIPETANRGASSTVGVAYVIEDVTTGAIVTTGTSSATFKRVSGGTKSGNFWKVSGEGGTAEFKLSVNSFNPVAAGTYRVQILSVGFAASAATPTKTTSATPDYDFEGAEQFIQS